MAEAPAWVPALTLRLQLQGLATLGLDAAHVQAALGLLPEAPDALVPAQAYVRMWHAAEPLHGPGLASALAGTIAFGAFGALDYLVGSADTVAGGCESARLHFAMVSTDTALEIDPLDDGGHALRVRALAPMPVQALEFTLATLFLRLRQVTGGGFRPRLLGLPVARPAGDDDERVALFGQAPAYGHPCAEMLIDAATWALPTCSADPMLHAALKDMAAKLELAQPGDSSLQQALRARLRDALAQGHADAARLAELLGVSERTLQRRLADIGRSFSEVVEEFRREEAARLLATPGLALVEVASRLGYAEQTSFTRAFRRWTGVTPGRWRAGRR